MISVVSEGKDAVTYEKLVLSPLLRRIRLPEREPNEKAARNVQHDLRQKIGRVAPVALHITAKERRNLISPGRRELGPEGG